MYQLPGWLVHNNESLQERQVYGGRGGWSRLATLPGGDHQQVGARLWNAGEIHGNPHFGWLIFVWKQTGKHGMAGQRSLIQIGWFLLFCLERRRNMLEIWCRTFFDSKTWLISGDILCLWQQAGCNEIFPSLGWFEVKSRDLFYVGTYSTCSNVKFPNGGQLLLQVVLINGKCHVRGYVTMDERYIKNQDHLSMET